MPALIPGRHDLQSIFCANSELHTGGVLEDSVLVKEDPSVWQPMQPPKAQPQSKTGKLGQVAGMAKGLNGSVWVFHRGSRVWDGSSFSGAQNEHVTYKEPIKEKTVYQLDQDTGWL